MAKLINRHEENIKTDNQYTFLQNLSHEVRTPMNAIVGLSEILLRRTKDLEEREYLLSMQAATQHLVMVINNIIDYDAMNSGTLTPRHNTISLEKLVRDILAMGRVMIGDRDVLFVTDINPCLPAELIIDEDRIKQVVVYFLSNAAKSTKWGHIAFGIDYADETKEYLRFSIENTEAGLPIMADLIEYLGSKLRIETNENGGTDVYYDVKLTIPEDYKAKEKEKLPGSYALCLKNDRERAMLIRYFKLSEVPCKVVDNPTELFIFSAEERPDVLITDYERVDKLRSVKEFRELGVRVIGIASEKDGADKFDESVLMRPVFYSDLEKVITLSRDASAKENERLLLKDVRILVVDDNAINLKVSAGLLEPYKCSVETATGGEEAIRMIHRTKYDLVFMDHMMPGMDGTEAVQIIRSSEEQYFKELPIIALTANVLDESRKLFSEVGMNDFIAKPIVTAELDAILRKWIPKDKQTTEAAVDLQEESGIPDFGKLRIQHINPRIGLSYTGGNGKMYMSILEEYLGTAPAKNEMLERLCREGDISRYTIEVHALKSLSKTIGATTLGAIAEELEKKGHLRDVDGIAAGHGNLKEEFETVIKELETIMEAYKPKTEKQPLEKENVAEKLKDIFHAMENFDYDAAEQAMAEIEKYGFDEIAGDCVAKLKECVDMIDYEGTGKQAVRLLALMGDD